MATAAAIALLSASGCVHAHAKAAEVLPPLDVPAPPPRIVETTDVEAPPPIGLIQDPGRTLPPGAARPVPAAPAKAEASKPEAPKPEAPPAQAEVPKPPDETPKPAPPAATLQTTPAGQEGEVEARIRAVVAHATTDLSRIDYSRLSANAKAQYDSAKRFISLSEAALQAKNLVYAETLAGKAAELAAQLPAR